MEYEFIKDFSTGHYSVKLSSEQSTIARWLNSEIDGESKRLEHLLIQLNGLNQVNAQKLVAGREYSIIVDDNEVQVFLNSSHNGAVQEENLSELLGSDFHYDESEQAGCGLDDLMLLLNDWRTFLQ